MTQFVEGVPADDVCVLELVGEVDITSANELVEAARRCMSTVHVLEIDLGGLTFIDSSGLGALVRIRNEAEEQAKSMILTHVSSPANRLLQVTGLDRTFSIKPKQA